MKLITYQLTPEGKIPDYVLDGGYFLNPSGSLVGIATDDAPEDAMTKQALTDYVSSFASDFTDPITGDVTLLAVVIQNFWNNKMGN